MGACALTTTGFPIDRDETARALGFEGLAENSYGAIAAIDYATESAAAVAVAMVNAGKFTQDLLLWSTREFGFLRLSDAFVQTSSIMPQKRNPVSLEHVRILASRAFGEAQAVLTCAHNTPFGDINDSEDDLQPLVFTMFADALRALKLLAGAVSSAKVDREALARRAGQDFLCVTELADTLVRSEGMSFREAHHLVAQTVDACGARDGAATIATTLRTLAPKLRLTDAELNRSLDPAHFVKIRSIKGWSGPGNNGERARRRARGTAAHRRVDRGQDRTTSRALSREGRASIRRLSSVRNLAGHSGIEDLVQDSEHIPPELRRCYAQSAVPLLTTN